MAREQSGQGEPDRGCLPTAALEHGLHRADSQNCTAKGRESERGASPPPPSLSSLCTAPSADVRVKNLSNSLLPFIG